ncbi:MAG: hypothetical protein JWQ79_2181 [Mucilaginibacter sp.]|nr:hypothetical protein [Mucilaginibacter sp.]
MKAPESEFSWLRNRGYLHITPQVNLEKDRDKIISIVKNKNFVSRYAFFPLIHSTINERRYKRINADTNRRAHSFENEQGETVKNIKSRPLHYASHLDAIIFGYYAEIILEKYEEKLFSIPDLSDCVTAYRKISIDGENKNKGTIHFANDTFNEIRKRADKGCEVLKFDIKSFFSRINHNTLKCTWADLLGADCLPADHYNVFKAATRFSYILKDDFRIKQNYCGKRSGFDEKKLARIRKKGVHSFFETVKDFRDEIKNGNLKIHQFPFRDKNGVPVGIPQGLPISAALANLYLLGFDIKIFDDLVKKLGAFYRRYSDDIIIICQQEQANFIEDYIIKAIKESKVEISTDKTERFLFEKNNQTLLSYKVVNGTKKVGVPFTYLGFEFYGNKTLIKSTNLSKFYRRMIKAVKIKSQRSLNVSMQNPNIPIAVFKHRLYKLYTKYPLNDTKIRTNYKRLIKNDLGEYYYKITKKTRTNRSNYLSYVHRSADIMGEGSIRLQLRNHSRIFNDAINKHIKKAKELQYK